MSTMSSEVGYLGKKVGYYISETVGLQIEKLQSLKTLVFLKKQFCYEILL